MRIEPVRVPPPLSSRPRCTITEVGIARSVLRKLHHAVATM